MRIVTNGFFWGRPATGSGQYVYQLVRAIAELEPSLEQTLVLPRELSAETLTLNASSGESSPLRAERSASNITKVWFEQVVFPRVGRRLDADLSHVPYFAPPLFSARPTVVTIHDLIPLILPAYRGSWRVRLYMRLVATAAPRAAAIIADSDCSRRDIVRLLGVPPERVSVVYLAADDRFRQANTGGPAASTSSRSPESMDSARRKYALPERYILYLGGFDQRKNVRGLMTAYAQVLREAPDAPPLVVGGRLPERDTDFSPDPRRLAREAGLEPAHVRFVGWVDEADKPALYSGALVFVFYSLYEGFGLPLLEAMTCGVPVVASGAASLPEVVGSAGLAVAPDDPRDLAAAILQIVRDPALAAELRVRSLAQAARFSWRRCAAETLDVYRRVARAR